MSAILVVMRKELRDALRDRRSVMSLFIFPVIGPLMILFMFNKIIDTIEESQDITLPVVGADYAPDLMDHLRQNGISLTPLDAVADGVFSAAESAAIATSIAERTYNFVLLIPADFGQHIADGTPVNVELHYDSSRQNEAAKVGRLESLLQSWGSETATLRLMARGIDANLLRPLTVARVNVASGQARAQSVLGVVSMLVLMAAFVSGVGIAVDATAGERERKSLEPLLVNPVARSTFILGKWLAASAFSTAGLVMVMGLNVLALQQVPLEELGISFILGPQEIIGMLLVTIPIGFFATALQLLIGLFARSFKDAQVYIGLLSLLPMLPFYYNLMNETGREVWMSLVPLLGQNMLLTDIVSGRSPSGWDFFLAGVTLVFWALLALMLATRQLRRERLLYA
jgi:sodium transport system permease protein